METEEMVEDHNKEIKRLNRVKEISDQIKKLHFVITRSKSESEQEKGEIRDLAEEERKRMEALRKHRDYKFAQKGNVRGYNPQRKKIGDIARFIRVLYKITENGIVGIDTRGKPLNQNLKKCSEVELEIPEKSLRIKDLEFKSELSNINTEAIIFTGEIERQKEV